MKRGNHVCTAILIIQFCGITAVFAASVDKTFFVANCALSSEIKLALIAHSLIEIQAAAIAHSRLPTHICFPIYFP